MLKSKTFTLIFFDFKYFDKHAKPKGGLFTPQGGRFTNITSFLSNSSIFSVSDRESNSCFIFNLSNNKLIFLIFLFRSFGLFPSLVYQL